MLNNTTSKAVISVLNDLFSKFGIPRVLETDNGPQYISQEFKSFIKEWKYYPRGNLLAERAVPTAKGILKKCNYEKSDIQSREELGSSS